MTPIQSSSSSAPVLICGAGPVGLATSIELARHGVRSIVFERHLSTSTHPRARNLNTRTLELMRGWGHKAHDAIAALHLPAGWSQEMVYVSTLSGLEYGRSRTRGFGGYGDGADAISPDGPVLSSQDMFEPVFVATALASGMVDIRFGHEITKAVNQEASVEISVLDHTSGQHYSCTADYLIAADGAASPIREQMGIPMTGLRSIGHYVNVYFRADLSAWTAHRPAPMYWIANTKQGGVIQSLDGHQRWLCQISYDGTAETLAQYDNTGCIHWLRQAVGGDSIQPEIISVGTWTMNAVVADRFSHGRVFLVGDSAQQMPPTGGFGINTGFQCAHNLAWKMAYVLSGRADPALLNTYEPERRPISRYNTDNALSLARYIVAFVAAGRGLHPDQLSPTEAVQQAWRYGNFLGVELGYAYSSTAITSDGSEAPQHEDPIIEYTPVARPGHRAPHLWLQIKGQRLSSLDLFGTDFSLVASHGEAWSAAANSVAAALKLELKVHHIVDESDPFEHLYGVETGGAVLVRPDGHVAARWPVAPADAAAALSQALRRALCRP